MIYWFIGQPAHGKTVLSNLLKERLEEKYRNGRKVFRVDGDDLRSLTANQDYSREGREQNIKRAQTIAQYLHNQGHDVIVSLVAPYRELREEFKQRVGEVMEFYVHTTEIRGREHFHTAEFEEPLENFIDVDTTGISPEDSIEQIMTTIFKGGDQNGKYKTIFCDIDGTIFKYRTFSKYQIQEAEVIESTREYLLFMKNNGHHIVLTTARPEGLREFTINELEAHRIPYNQLVMGIERGSRILINDRENDSDEDRAISVNLRRDEGFL